MIRNVQDCQYSSDEFIEKVTLDIDIPTYPTNTFTNIIRGVTNFKITVPPRSKIGVDIVNNNLYG